MTKLCHEERPQPAPAAGQNVAVIDPVIFHLDGVLAESEQLRDAARRELVTDAGDVAAGGHGVMQGTSSTEWSAYLPDALGVPMDPSQISITWRGAGQGRRRWL